MVAKLVLSGGRCSRLWWWCARYGPPARPGVTQQPRLPAGFAAAGQSCQSRSSLPPARQPRTAWSSSLSHLTTSYCLPSKQTRWSSDWRDCAIEKRFWSEVPRSASGAGGDQPVCRRGGLRSCAPAHLGSSCRSPCSPAQSLPWRLSCSTAQPMVSRPRPEPASHWL